MAGESAQISLTIGQTGQNDLAQAKKLQLELKGDGPEPGEVFVDLFPDDFRVDLNVTEGSFFPHSSSRKKVEEFLSFSNSDRVSLKFGDPQFVSVQAVGNFIDADTANTFNPFFRVNREAAEISLTRKAFGVVKVNYEAPFRRVKYTFDGECPLEPPEPDSNGIIPKIFKDATMVAILDLAGDGKAIATLNLSNPNARCKFLPDDSEKHKMRVEIVKQLADPSTAFSNFRFVTLLRFFPAGVQPTMTVTRGTVPKKCEKKTIEVEDEFLVFNGGSSVLLEYPVEKGVSVSSDGAFVDEFGVKFVVSDNMFAKPGDTVEEVEWTSSTEFKSSASFRKVKKGEIVLTDGSDHVKPAFGVGRAGYAIDYDAYIYEHVLEKDNTTKEVLAKETVLTVRRGKLVQNFLIPLRALVNPKPVQAECDIGVT